MQYKNEKSFKYALKMKKYALMMNKIQQKNKTMKLLMWLYGDFTMTL